MNHKFNKKALLASVLSLLLCMAMLVGTTFAWFTDTASSTGNKIVAGKLNVDLELFGKTEGEWKSVKDDKAPIFDYEDWEPGYVDVKLLRVENQGTLALKWKAVFVSKAPLSDLANVIDVYVRPYGVAADASTVVYPTDRALDGYVRVGTVAEFVNTIEETTNGILLEGETAYLGIALKMQETAGNEYQEMDLGEFDINILATQLASEFDSIDNQYDANAEYPVLPDQWDGTIDLSWYDPDATEYTLGSAEALAGLAALVDGTVPATYSTVDFGTLPVTFEGKTIYLNSDIDLKRYDEDGNLICFDPIGDKVAFEGTFDGQGHTIKNLYQSGWAFGYEWGSYGSIGLFGEVKDATIKNVTISGFDACVEGGDVGGITGSATGTCVFENITINDSDFGTYNNGIGGIIGWSGDGNYTFKNITIEEDVVLGGLWGSFDSSIGGVVGQGEPSATYNFENVSVACRLDAYNDVTAAYKYYIYRMTGMLIGRLEETTTIDGRNYPDMSKYNIICKDVTVTYGNWVDYHYCVVAGKTAWRVEPGYAYGGIPADHDHSTCAMHCNLLLTFEGLFGGAQYGVNAITKYDGVTVVYNNK